MRRRRWLLGAAGGAWAAAFGVATAADSTPATPRRITVTARKFEFSETEIHARAGESILLVVTSIDFMHGFAMPKLNLRADVPPGRTVTLALPELRPGRYTYLCDNFCGEGHDEMSGTLVVTDG